MEWIFQVEEPACAKAVGLEKISVLKKVRKG